uniref:Uncharacterized protein n=1 Tax=Meloidogyne enterolobii TaxID=390850 RepID=A0A6V7WDW7_MELEN|nr:unnamed protein product [Meloidogyne enterolobii]
MRKNILISCLLFLMFCLFDVLASPGESSGQGELNPPPKLQIFLQGNDEPYIRLLRTYVSVKVLYFHVRLITSKHLHKRIKFEWTHTC